MNVEDTVMNVNTKIQDKRRKKYFLIKLLQKTFDKKR